MTATAAVTLVGCPTPPGTPPHSEPRPTVTTPSEPELATGRPPDSAATSNDHPLADAPLGRPGCEPASPVVNREGLVESRLTAAGIDGWALLWARPPWPTGEEVKVVWRVSGSGDLDAVALGPDGQGVEPAWGPRHHASSNWDRPGDEWGLAFELDTPGCWELQVSRGEGSASLWVEVLESQGWVDDDDRQAWEAEHGPAIWVVGYFLPPDYDYDTFDADVLVRRWQRIADDDLGPDRSQLLAEALAALPGAAPAGLDNSWQAYSMLPGHELDLGSAHLEGDEVVLDFSSLEASSPGTTAAMVMGMQFDAVVSHYYPEAEDICVLVRGEPSFWLHDMVTCPSRQ